MSAASVTNSTDMSADASPASPIALNSVPYEPAALNTCSRDMPTAVAAVCANCSITPDASPNTVRVLLRLSSRSDAAEIADLPMSVSGAVIAADMPMPTLRSVLPNCVTLEPARLSPACRSLSSAPMVAYSLAASIAIIRHPLQLRLDTHECHRSVMPCCGHLRQLPGRDPQPARNLE